MLSRSLRLTVGRIALPWRLKERLPGAARQIWQVLEQAGHEVYLVGGAVRDLLLGVVPKDWDLATSADAEAITRLMTNARIMGGSRGGVTVLLPTAGSVYEVTPYRGDSLAADLLRRDFTINAMALDRNGRLQDPMGGRADLGRGLIRACGLPGERLQEDPLRMFRAVRLAAYFDFGLEPSLSESIHRLASSLGQVAPERIGAELGRLLLTDRPAWGMKRLQELGLLEHFAPELVEMVGVEQNQYHAFAVWEHALMALALAPPQLPLRLAALLHDVGKPRTLSLDEGGNRHFYRHEQVGAEMADTLLARLRFDNKTRRRVVHLVRVHMDLHFDVEVGDGAIRRMISRIGPDYMHDLIQLRRADRLASGTRHTDLSWDTVEILKRVERVLAEDAALQVTDLLVDGHDVVRAFGLPPGSYVGRVLSQLLQEVLEEPSRNDRQWLLSRLAALTKV